MKQDCTNLRELSRNERLVLSLIRRHGPLARAALAQRTGLSAQAITNLTRKLISDGFLDSGKVVRGKVGQPSTPLDLAPDGAWFLGLKLGRRLIELALVDFAGSVRIHRQELCRFPHPDHVATFARQGAEAIMTTMSSESRSRISGMGIAAPFRLWDWGVEMGDWRERDLRAELAADFPFPVFLENDASTACAAELVFGRSVLPEDFLHFYIAHFAGGGIVLDGKLRLGPNRNAGALGSMPIANSGQLLEVASIATLESRIETALPRDFSGWMPPPPEIEAEWARDAGRSLAFAAMSAVALLDLSMVVIDGAVPPATRALLVEETRRAISEMPAAGIDRPEVVEGTLGNSARTLGAAALPLSHFFLPDGKLS
ncbi:ROK family transcriptional regulator [Paracoccus caeni]|uniref:ROK family transcriptional regulator n=2 Tax=Paracoccus caeni TaxID=657651 RepID=A0A934SBE6_9RHOB|nr:ROK family transcriptional regulator [Paracoccus caeni]